MFIKYWINHPTMSNELPDKKDRKIALVVIDVQRKFTGGTVQEGKEAIKTMNAVSKMFREHNRPVIFVHYDGPCHCTAYDKEDGDEYLHGIISGPKDITVHKDRMNSFLGSRLADVIKECGCDSILLVGMVTQCCVLGTYFGAFEFNISPYLLAGGLISTEDKFNDAAYVLCKTFTLEEAEENLRTTKTPEPTKLYGSVHQICGVAGQ